MAKLGREVKKLSRVCKELKDGCLLDSDYLFHKYMKDSLLRNNRFLQG